MSVYGSELEAPLLLLAMPQVQDPFFHHSVVLLLHHSDEGSFGFIVNRPTGIRVADILEGMKISWRGDPEALALFGGPVQPQLGTVLFGAEENSLTSSTENEEQGQRMEILPGLGLSQNVSDLAELAEAPPERFRLLLGYAGWSEGQLMQEIVRNDWLTAPVDSNFLFAPEIGDTWVDALRSLGIDPDTLPSWTVQTDEETN